MIKLYRYNFDWDVNLIITNFAIEFGCEFSSKACLKSLRLPTKCKALPSSFSILDSQK